MSSVPAVSLSGVAVPGRLSSVDWVVPTGTAVALIGANGAGKSSLLHVLAGRLRPREGDARILGVPVRDPTAASLRAYVPQRIELPHHLLVEELLRATAHAMRVPVDEVDAAVHRMALEHILGWRLGDLSGGMQQRVALAGGLLGAPAVWLLDEPATALDADGLTHLGAWCREHVQNGGTVITSAHRPEEVDAFADEACLIYEGEIVAQRNVGELFAFVDQQGAPIMGLEDAAHVQRVPGPELRSVLDGTWQEKGSSA